MEAVVGEHTKQELCRELIPVDVFEGTFINVDICFIKRTIESSYKAYKHCLVHKKHSKLSIIVRDIRNDQEYVILNPHSVLVLPFPKYLK